MLSYILKNPIVRAIYNSNRPFHSSNIASYGMMDIMLARAMFGGKRNGIDEFTQEIICDTIKQKIDNLPLQITLAHYYLNVDYWYKNNRYIGTGICVKNKKTHDDLVDNNMKDFVIKYIRQNHHYHIQNSHILVHNREIILKNDELLANLNRAAGKKEILAAYTQPYLDYIMKNDNKLNCMSIEFSHALKNYEHHEPYEPATLW